MKMMKAIAGQMSRSDIAFSDGYHYGPLLLPHLKIPAIYYLDEPPRGFYEKNLRTDTLRDHLGAVIDYPFSVALKNLDKECVKHADLIITNSKYSQSYVRDIYGDLDIRVNYLGVDKSVFRPLNIERDIILSAGALIHAKQHDFVIRAVSKLKDPPPLVILGKGDEAGNLARLAEELGVEMKVVSDITDEALNRYYNRALLTAIAYIREPFGLVAIESMACRTPVVAVAEGGLKESVVDGGTGRLVPRNEAKFAKAVQELLASPADRERMGKAGLARVEEQFTWDTCADGLVKLVSEVASNKKAHGTAGGGRAPS